STWYIPPGTLASALCCFSFLDSADHGYLHSFPTRRSSDLTGINQLLKVSSEVGARTNRVESAENRMFDNTLQLKSMLSSITDIEDRKSTRLNSSHVKISYAVFCLKKKNRAAVAGAEQVASD